MTHEIVKPALFDSGEFRSAKKPDGKYSYYASLRIMQVSAARVFRLVQEGLIDGTKYDTWNGLSLADLASLSTTIQQLKGQGKISIRRPRSK